VNETYLQADLLRLLELQGIDHEILRLRASIEKALGDPEISDLRRYLAEAEEVEAALADKVAKLKRTAAWEEKESSEIRDQVNAMERKMYGGEVSSVKELDQMGKRVEQLKEDIDRHEESGLAAIMELEEIEPRLAEARRAAGEIRERLGEMESRRDRKVAELEARIAELEPKRVEMAGRIPPQLLGRYDRIRQSRGGIGAAALDRRTGLCGACRVKVPVLLAESVRGGFLETCESCGRLLIHAGEEE